MIIATVADPWAVRTRAVIKKQTGNARVALPCRVPIALAMSVCFKTPPKAAPAAVIRTMTAPEERASDETLRSLSLSPEHLLAKMHFPRHSIVYMGLDGFSLGMFHEC